ncbi:hypothetical protein GXP67_21150 [Rhodocytophaga rosea]|uniref:Uncharacterized protein n=1 Tax=Rhodocytophaga rosea TaxID=2704465 RepID=A0A6C0GLS7_9BACT|nr:hypothetical protein [Rhodocytophaga rosea]QHT68978.1 hypothetical protein GXP67_21150 [Rhodocytophaga rosea]
MTPEEQKQFDDLKAENEQLRAFKQNNYLSTKLTREGVDFSRYSSKDEFIRHANENNLFLGQGGEKLYEDFKAARPELFNTK